MTNRTWPTAKNYDPYPFLPILSARVDLLESVRVLQRGDGIRKINAVSAAILGGLRSIPLVIHPQQNYWLPVVLSRPELISIRRSTMLCEDR
jgi:hypothetical protein